MPLPCLMQICQLFPYNVFLALLSFSNLASADFEDSGRHREGFKQILNKHKRQ